MNMFLPFKSQTFPIYRFVGRPSSVCTTVPGSTCRSIIALSASAVRSFTKYRTMLRKIIIPFSAIYNLFFLIRFTFCRIPLLRSSRKPNVALKFSGSIKFPVSHLQTGTACMYPESFINLNTVS